MMEMITSSRPIPPVMISCRFVDQAMLLACAVIVLADWFPAFESPAATAPTACCQASGDTAGRRRKGALTASTQTRSPLPRPEIVGQPGHQRRTGPGSGCRRFSHLALSTR
jgi:hypothetical protein